MNKPETRRDNSYVLRQNKSGHVSIGRGFYLDKTRLAVSASVIKE